MLGKRKLKMYREILEAADVNREPELTGEILLEIICQAVIETERRLKKHIKVGIETVDMFGELEGSDGKN